MIDLTTSVTLDKYNKNYKKFNKKILLLLLFYPKYLTKLST